MSTVAPALCDREPTVLADILDESFFADGIQNLLGEMTFGAIKEINPS